MNKSTNNKMLVAKATTTSNTFFKAIRTQLQFSEAIKQERKKERKKVRENEGK